MSRGKRPGEFDAISNEKKSKIESPEMSTINVNASPLSMYVNMSQNRYNANSTAPFTVYVYDKNPGNQLGNLHEFSLSKAFRPITDIMIKMKPLGKDKVVIYCRSYQGANSLVESRINSLNKNWGAVIPDDRVQSIGVINKIPIDMKDEEIHTLIKSSDPNTKVFKVERILKRDPDVDMTEEGQVKLIPTLLVKVFFKELTLPKSIIIDSIERNVRHYIPKVRRCFNCLRFGHLKDQCRSKSRCEVCSGEHDGKGCTNTSVSCVNC